MSIFYLFQSKTKECNLLYLDKLGVDSKKRVHHQFGITFKLKQVEPNLLCKGHSSPKR